MDLQFFVKYLMAVMLWPPWATAAPRQEPLCSVVMAYDEVNSDSPHWTAGFKVKTRQTLQPGAVFEVQLAGNHTSNSSPIPLIVGIKINGENICPTEKVFSTITTFSKQSASDINESTTITTTEGMEEILQTDATTESSTEPTTEQSMFDT